MIKKNITLIIGVAIPILMILFVAGSIYLPALFIKPQVNFLYSIGGYSSYYYETGHQYSVRGSKLTESQPRPVQSQYQPPQKPEDATLYIYDVVKKESREISFQEAQKLNLDGNLISSDGFEIVYGSRGESFFPFFFGTGTDYNVRYLRGHNVSQKLNLQLNESSYYNQFDFLGWVK